MLLSHHRGESAQSTTGTAGVGRQKRASKTGGGVEQPMTPAPLALIVDPCEMLMSHPGKTQCDRKAGRRTVH
jgi:DNA modification methylase